LERASCYQPFNDFRVFIKDDVYIHCESKDKLKIQIKNEGESSQISTEVLINLRVTLIRQDSLESQTGQNEAKQTNDFRFVVLKSQKVR